MQIPNRKVTIRKHCQTQRVSPPAQGRPTRLRPSAFALSLADLRRTASSVFDTPMRSAGVLCGSVTICVATPSMGARVQAVHERRRAKGRGKGRGRGKQGGLDESTGNVWNGGCANGHRARTIKAAKIKQEESERESDLRGDVKASFRDTRRLLDQLFLLAFELLQAPLRNIPPYTIPSFHTHSTPRR